MFSYRYTPEQLKKKVKELEDYLGPRLNYSMSNWPQNKKDRWIMEYCLLLKEEYYAALICQRNKNCSKMFFSKIFKLLGHFRH